MPIEKPAALHDRVREWAALEGFVTNSELGAKLGLVYGRRRQGKTLLLDLMAQQTNGFTFTALPLSSAQNLERLAGTYRQFTGGADVVFRDWDAAIDALLRLGEATDEPAFIFLDEFHYLVDAEPALPSIVQIALGPTSRAMTSSRARLVLCGSALSAMRGLLSGSAPLRGRAVLEMMVFPFGYRDAADFWGVRDQPELAFQLHALLGGTPAYRAMAGYFPDSVRDFDDFVAAGPLNPMSALFREGAVLLQEQPELSDVRLYYSVLGAIVRGACRRSEIAGVLGRADQSLTHPLAVLEATQLIERVDDAFRQRRPVYRIAEPMLRTHQLLIGPYEADLVGGAGNQIWTENANTVSSKIYGPHFEELARQWCRWHASKDTLGGRVSVVQSATLNCSVHRQGHELDVVAIAKRAGEPDQVLAIGEAKITQKPVGDGELARLEHLRDLLPANQASAPPKLLLFSRSDFTRELRNTAAGRDDIHLVDLPRLYNGD